LSTADLRAKAVRQQRRLRISHAGELLAALLFLVFSAVIAGRNSGLETKLWAAAVWATTADVTAFSLWNWNILWKANAKSVTEFAVDYEKRCMASLRAVRFGMRFIVVQIAIVVPWLTWDLVLHRLVVVRFAEMIALVACLALGFWYLFSHYRRISLRELEALQASQLFPLE
jgi:hypothetical protein